jgi:hypothetical protein
MEQCGMHIDLATKIAVMATDVAYIKDTVCKHIIEGEEKGGFRDRLVIAELAVTSLSKEIAALKTAKWVSAGVAGLIGGLVSQITPEAAGWIIKLISH